VSKWKANKLPVIGCPSCLGDTFVCGEKCITCGGWGYFPTLKSKSVSTSAINNQITKTIQSGNTN